MSQPLSDEKEEVVNIAIAVSQLDGAGGSLGGSQTADWAKALCMSIQPWS